MSSKAPRALRYSSADQMPAGMRTLLANQQRPYTPPAAAAGDKRSKYGAKPTVVDGIRFDSQAEARYYERLKLRVAAGEVSYFLRQVPLHLPGNTRYVLDFLEVLADGSIRHVDVKGVQTDVFRLKKRQVEALYPITIELAK